MSQSRFRISLIIRRSRRLGRRTLQGKSAIGRSALTAGGRKLRTIVDLRRRLRWSIGGVRLQPFGASELAHGDTENLATTRLDGPPSALTLGYKYDAVRNGLTYKF